MITEYTYTDQIQHRRDHGEKQRTTSFAKGQIKALEEVSSFWQDQVENQEGVLKEMSRDAVKIIDQRIDNFRGKA